MRNKLISIAAALSIAAGSTAGAVFAATADVPAGTAESGAVFNKSVWIDENYNNTVDEGEKGVEGVTVEFLDPETKTSLYSAKTDANGEIKDLVIECGTYIIRMTIPEEYKYYYGYTVYTDDTSSNMRESDDSPYIYEYDYSVPEPDEVYVRVPLSKISDPWLMGYVWEDVNENTIRPVFEEWNDEKNDEPETEKGIANATITVYDKAGNKIAEGTTGEDGSYGFSVPVGVDTVKATLPNGYESYGFTVPEDGTITKELIDGEEMLDFGAAKDYTPPARRTNPTAAPDPGTTTGLIPPATMTAEPTATPEETEEPTAAPTEAPSATLAPGDPPQLNKTEHYAYVVGYDDGTIRPENNISRQEVATIFFRLLEDSSRDYFYSKSNNFTDVPSSLWSNTAVSTMTKANIITGYQDDTFRPTNNITRAEFATIAAKFDSSSYIGPDKFTDISGHWAAEYINRSAEKGWISGYDDGTFRPNEYITRAEAMTLINRVLDRQVKAGDMLPEMTAWPDNTSDKWYYTAIQEATNSHYYEKEANAVYEVWTTLRETRDWTELEKK